MVVAVLSVLVALFLGFGAVEELIVRGIHGGEVQPFFVGLAGIAVSVLLAASGVGWWRRWPGARRLVVLAAVSSVLFHVLAALPPHRNVGLLALLVGAGYGLILLGVAVARGGRGGGRPEPEERRAGARGGSQRRDPASGDYTSNSPRRTAAATL